MSGRTWKNAPLLSTPTLASMMPLAGMAATAGSGNPVFIDPAGWNEFAALNTLFCFTGKLYA